ncbi:hypothetical protein CPSG_05332 [Coccidioides posadasii str. Silveira]|uniref:Uncharacterized protein n=1 Tax=Coccidioides posadasii (strain RMSCC 757 / Silveira) TaxID=443226 RepID=E9D564_COCPS|nr:hypothetical protein CPSG_05332 [Coccidioides posadasii str. Silveira]
MCKIKWLLRLPELSLIISVLSSKQNLRSKSNSNNRRLSLKTIKSLKEQDANLKLLSSSAKRSRDLRHHTETMSADEEIQRHQVELEDIKERILVLRRAITLLSQQG